MSSPNRLEPQDPAEFRSHRRLGEQLDLFHFPAHSPGMASWHPKGVAILDELRACIRQLHARHGYVEVSAPLVCDHSLWERSGHLGKFADKMFHLEVDGRPAALKPMNCPGHCDFYSHRPRSYRELPLRIAEQGLRDALDHAGVGYVEQPGEGAFYGPKVDVHLSDGLDRAWQMGSVQLDYQLPERFDLRFVGANGSELDERGAPHRPVIIHRALLGSFERFLAILLEHHDGRLPLWLAPEQVRVLPVGADQHDYARRVAERLAAAGLRAGVDLDGPLAGRIRASESARVNVVAVAGGREAAGEAIALREGGEQRVLGLDEAVAELAARSAERR